MSDDYTDTDHYYFARMPHYFLSADAELAALAVFNHPTGPLHNALRTIRHNIAQCKAYRARNPNSSGPCTGSRIASRISCGALFQPQEVLSI